MELDQLNRLKTMARTNAIIANGIRAEGGIEAHDGVRQQNDLVDIIDALDVQQQALTARLMVLEAICPRKIRVGSQTLVYRCPENLIPEIRKDNT